jgi:hypothetical protein
LHCGAHSLLSLLGDKPFAAGIFVISLNLALWACKTP